MQTTLYSFNQSTPFLWLLFSKHLWLDYLWCTSFDLYLCNYNLYNALRCRFLPSIYCILRLQIFFESGGICFCPRNYDMGLISWWKGKLWIPAQQTGLWGRRRVLWWEPFLTSWWPMTPHPRVQNRANEKVHTDTVQCCTWCFLHY